MVKVQDLSGSLLDYWVARAWIERGDAPFESAGPHGMVSRKVPGDMLSELSWWFEPVKCWSDCGPLIEAGKIELVWEKDGTVWACNNEGSGGDHDPRVAICRAWVKSVYGEEVPPFARGGK